MKNISCNETDCESNRSCFCKKCKILIEEDAKCESYRKKDSNKMHDYMEEYAIFNNETEVEDPLILCESASCISNDNGVCSRRGISVEKRNLEPFCSSYESKEEY